MTDDSSTKAIEVLPIQDNLGWVESEVGKGPVFTFFTTLNRGEMEKREDGRMRTAHDIGGRIVSLLNWRVRQWLR